MGALFIIALCTFPFNAYTPQKFFMRHVARKFFTNGILESNDSGYVIFPMDRRLYISANRVENFSMLTNLQRTCLYNYERREEFCRMPIFYPKEFSMGIHYLPGVEPRKTSPKFKVHKVASNITDSGLTYYKFIIEGPHVILLGIVPKWNAKLIDWNLSPKVGENAAFQVPYIVHFSYGSVQVNHTLELYFKVSFFLC